MSDDEYRAALTVVLAEMATIEKQAERYRRLRGAAFGLASLVNDQQVIDDLYPPRPSTRSPRKPR